MSPLLYLAYSTNSTTTRISSHIVIEGPIFTKNALQGGEPQIDEYQFRLTLIHVERLCHFQALPHQLPCGHRLPCGQGSLCSFTFDRRAFPQRSASIICH